MLQPGRTLTPALHRFGGTPQVGSRFPKIISSTDTIHLEPLEGSSYYLEIFVGTLVAVCICTFGVLVLQFSL